jgi:proline iminopeptidase
LPPNQTFPKNPSTQSMQIIGIAQDIGASTGDTIDGTQQVPIERIGMPNSTYSLAERFKSSRIVMSSGPARHYLNVTMTIAGKTLLALLTATTLVFSTTLEAKTKSVGSAVKIDSLYDVTINGCLQKILVQSNDMNNPILLYLHGGPGSSIMFLSHAFSRELKDHFVLVNWDQRGTALSYHDGMDTSKISEHQIRDDALVLTRYLLRTFHKRRLFLIGHSFGSVIGLQLVANHPEYFSAYIGVGQVATDWNKSVAITYRWLHDTLEKANDTSGLKRIEAENFPYIDLITKYGGHHRLSIDLDSVIKSSPHFFEGYLDLLRKGKSFSQKYVGLNPKPREASDKSIYDINVPLYFFEGKHDHVIACAPQLVVEYCDRVKAPKKGVVWFSNSAHYICVEEPEKFQDELITIAEQND